MSTILDGKATSNQIKEELAQEVTALKASGKRPPHLAAVLVGNDGASLTYVGSKVRSCEKIGFDSTLIRLEDTISQDELIKTINKLNNDATLDGFIVQLPLPKHIDEEVVLHAINPNKRVAVILLIRRDSINQATPGSIREIDELNAAMLNKTKNKVFKSK